jgi:hypothetical protein
MEMGFFSQLHHDGQELGMRPRRYFHKMLLGFFSYRDIYFMIPSEPAIEDTGLEMEHSTGWDD